MIKKEKDDMFAVFTWIYLLY